MCPKKSDRSQDKFLNHLINVISESVDEDQKALREALADEELNYDEIANEGLEFVQSLKREHRFDKAAARRKRLMDLLKQVKNKTYEGTKDQLLETLKGMFSGKPAAAYFQKLESVQEDDLQNIIKESEILKLFNDELKKE